MTTPTDPDRDGPIDDLPYLPPPRTSTNDPSTTGPLTLPDAAESIAAHAEYGAAATSALDARQLVDSQRTRVASPAYGTLPTVADGSLHTNEQLRAEAQRKRRQDARLGWALAIVMFGVAGVGGWLVYRAFGTDPDADPADRAAPADRPDVSIGVSADERAAGGGLDAAVADARDVLSGSSGSSGSAGAATPDVPATRPGPSTVPVAPAQPPETATDFDTVPPDQTGPPPRIANRPPFRTVLYDLRVYDGVEPDATFRHYEVTYDTLTDDYFGFINDEATGETEFVSFNGAWRYSVGPDGVNQRVRRSKLSSNTEPDTPLANLLAETEILPLEARPYATLVEERPDDVLGVDGTEAVVYGYRLNLDAFRAADSEAYLRWRQLWTTAQHDNVDLIVPGTEQIRSSDVTTYGDPRNRERYDLSGFEVLPEDRQAAIIFSVTERGIINVATVVSREDDLRIVYIADEINDEEASVPFPDDAWVDAPDGSGG